MKHVKSKEQFAEGKYLSTLPKYFLDETEIFSGHLMLGSQMRLPSTGPSLPLPSPRHFVGGGVAGGVAQGQDIESSIQNWRETFLNKYHEQAREVSTDYISL